MSNTIKLKKGDPFNATILRHSINKLQNKGFFEDVNVGFEPSEEDPEQTDIILTVSEQKTGKVGLSVSHGSCSRRLTRPEPESISTSCSRPCTCHMLQR